MLEISKYKQQFSRIKKSCDDKWIYDTWMNINELFSWSKQYEIAIIGDRSYYEIIVVLNNIHPLMFKYLMLALVKININKKKFT